MERYPDTLRLFAHALGLNSSYFCESAAKHHITRERRILMATQKALDEWPDSTIRELNATLKTEWGVYEEAKRIFEQQLTKYGAQDAPLCTAPDIKGAREWKKSAQARANLSPAVHAQHASIQALLSAAQRCNTKQAMADLEKRSAQAIKDLFDVKEMCIIPSPDGSGAVDIGLVHSLREAAASCGRSWT